MCANVVYSEIGLLVDIVLPFTASMEAIMDGPLHYIRFFPQHGLIANGFADFKHFYLKVTTALNSCMVIT